MRKTIEEWRALAEEAKRLTDRQQYDAAVEFCQLGVQLVEDLEEAKRGNGGE